MTELYILVGNVGLGKSFFAKELAKLDVVVVNMDSIQQSISGGEYGAYDENKKSIYRKVEISLIEEAFSCGFSVCIDRTNMDRKRRERFINIGKKFTDDIICFNFGKGSDDSLARRIEDNRGISEEVWINLHNKLKGSYEKPLYAEGFSRIFECP